MTPAFDFNFDRTFGARLIDAEQTATQAGCRKEGVYLTWLTLQGGWEYWLFEGYVIQNQSPKSRGQVDQGGLIRDTQRVTADVLTLHTANLTYEEAQRVGSIRKSIAVYMLVHNEDNTITVVPVTIPAADAQLWNPASYTNDFTTTITLPSNRSQRL